MQAVANVKELRIDEASEGNNARSKADNERSLLDAREGQTYIIREIDTDDDEMNAFLFRLGCYSGEPITVISRKKKSCIVAIKDSRYTLDKALCEAIII